jgi:serine/threonine-protein kinase HipA
MDRSGQWSLSPAYDVTYSYNPTGIWTGSHQMSLNGKRDRFTLEDLEACAQSASMKRGVAAEIVRQVHDAVARWPVFAEQAGVAEADMERVRRAQRLDLLS